MSPLCSTSRYDLGSSTTFTRTDSSCSSPLKPSTLDLSYSALPESKPTSTGSLLLPSPRGPSLGHQSVGGSPIQPAVRTQMWLSEQMEYRPGPEGCGLSAWQQEQQQRDRMRQEAELTQVGGKLHQRWSYPEKIQYTRGSWWLKSCHWFQSQHLITEASLSKEPSQRTSPRRPSLVADSCFTW